MNDSQIENQARKYSEATNIHSGNPASGSYWGERYVTPMLREVFGAGDVVEFYSKFIAEKCALNPSRRIQSVSIGCGECAEEIAVCRQLIGLGYSNIHFHCVDIAGGALERAARNAAVLGIGDHFSFKAGVYDDDHPVDVAIATHSLHHIVNLEELFDRIKSAIGEDGIFLTTDMIGRNGHMLWPEALAIVDRMWERLPDKYKYNNCLRRFESQYSNWDNSREENEGIRAQDILPELIKRFNFDYFFAFGNISFTLFGTHFGHNFDPADAADRALIDQIGQMDFDLIDFGYLKPVQMFACMSNRKTAGRFFRHWTPEFCVRSRDPLAHVAREPHFDLGEAIEFSERLPGAECLIEGWSSAEQGGVWSNAASSKIRLPIRGVTAGHRYVLTLVGFQFRPLGFEVGPIAVSVQGRTVGNMEFGGHLTGEAGPGAVEFEAISSSDVLEIDLHYANSFVPAEIGLGEERRRFALRLIYAAVYSA